MKQPAKVVRRNETAAVWVDTAKLKPWARNPRKNDQNVERVIASINEFGFGAPILARRENGEVIAGHTRLKAAIELGMSKVPVRYLDLDAHKAHLLALADNRIGEHSEWSDPELFSVLKDYDMAEIELAGWSEDELAKLDIDSPGEPPEESPTPDAPEDPITKLGDVWRLGDHTLICGDGREAPGGFGMVVTDPPYGIDIAKTGKVGAEQGAWHSAQKGTYAPIAGDDKTPEVAWLIELASVSIIWGGNYFADLPGSGGWLVWDKRGDTGIENTFADCELAWSNRTGPARIHRQLWNGMIREGEHSKRQHPTQKPVALMQWCLTFGEGTVLDPYAGSGSTLIACENAGRACTAYELSPAYCDVIVQRWQELTGAEAVREPAYEAPKVKRIGQLTDVAEKCSGEP